MSPFQIGSYSIIDSVIIAKALTKSNIKMSVSNTKSIGVKIPKTQSLAEIASIASGLSLTNIKNTDATRLASLVQNMDLANMNSFQKGYITTIVTSSKSVIAVKTLLRSTSDQTIINSVPNYLFSSLSRYVADPTSDLDASNLPLAYVEVLI